MKKTTLLGAFLALSCMGAAFGEPVKWSPQVQTSTPLITVSATPRTIDAEFATGFLDFPAISLKPATADHWNFSASRYFSIKLENLCDDAAVSGNVSLNDDHHGSDLGVWVLEAGETRRFTWELCHQESNRFDPLFKAHNMPNGFSGGRNLNLAQVTSISIFCPNAGFRRIRISDLQVHGTYESAATTATPEQFFPLLDEFGQSTHEEWPEKIHSEQDLTTALAREKASLRECPADWNRFGGWATGPQLRATGAFRTEKWNGKWYFVDPEGKLFLSRGVNGVYAGNDWMFQRVGSAAALYHGQNLSPEQVFNHYRLNCEKKYRDTDWNEFQIRRLWSWGFNTVGAWSERQLTKLGKIPYTEDIGCPGDAAMRLESASLADPFAPGFKNKIMETIRNTGTAADPFCIGYFSGNEHRFGAELNPANLILRCGAAQPAKQAMRRFLEEQYHSIAALNHAWQTTYSSWDEFATTPASLVDNAATLADRKAFSTRYAEAFYQVQRDAIREAAPGRLYLGSRFLCYDCGNAYLNRACAKYADVVSINYYTLSFDRFAYAGLPEDKPFMITETAWGRKERGTFGTFLCNPGVAKGAQEAAIRCSIESSLRHPQIVGVHYFSFYDQPLIGRWDGENHNFGLLDIADTPYDEILNLHRSLTEQMYSFRAAHPVAESR